MSRYAIMAPAGRRFPQAIERAIAADRSNCDSLWVPQQEDARDALVTLAAYAGATTRIGLGSAVLPLYATHPAAMVQAAATLDELARGRFRLGLGVGHRSIVADGWGLELGPPLAIMREYLEVVRAGLRDGHVEFSGKRFNVRSTYSGPRRSTLPILIAALRPRMIELAGELADGVIVWLATPEYVHDTVLPAVRRGLERSGRSAGGFEVVVIVNVCNTSDLETGDRIMAGMLQPALRFGSYRAVLGAQGVELGAGGEVGTAALGRLAAIGGPDLVRDRIDSYRRAGCTLPLIVPCPDHPGAAGLDATLAALDA